MQEVKASDLENMSVEELARLQTMLQEAQEKKKLGNKYLINKAIDKLLMECKLPTSYYSLMQDLKDLNQEEIIPSIMSNDRILRFPTLMVLSSFLPCSEIDIRCGLVELFDSYVYHSDFGLIIAGLAPFDVDRTLKCCRAHDPLVAQSSLEEFYRKLITVLNSPSLEGGPREWVKKCLDDVVYMTHVVAGINMQFRFATSLMFLLPDISVYDLENEKSHTELINRLQEDGSDLIYAKRISKSFKL